MKNLLVAAVLFLFVANAIGQESNSYSPEIKRVAVFKNGYAFTYREGEAASSGNWIYTTKTPIGVLGTVWGYSTSPGVRVNQLLASEVTNSSTERVKDIAEILLANEGKRIRVVDGYNTNKIYEGIYEVVSPYRTFSAGMITEGLSRPAIDLGLITIMLKTETGMMLLRADSVARIEILETQPILIKPRSEKQVRLGIKTEGAKDGQKITLGVAALERGIRWIPAYRVEVKGDPIKEAKLELEANVINDLADLNNSEINFVVGVPHFLFQDTASPLSINTAFAGVS
ncbi:MAG: hypothetical protein IT173_02840, partial [Acidobacteria bacterium]|nr:hypothetical protein [Acidobacteriota bacterium]